MPSSFTRWTELPGNFDTVNARHIFASDNSYDIPTLAPMRTDVLPRLLVPYGTRVRNADDAMTGGLHFFLDDYRFETLWSRPQQTLSGLARYGWRLTPDFSLYREWPLAIQIWNTYRSRWCGTWWQSQGLQVIPTLTWSTPRSYAFAFCGIAPNAVVAISTVGLQRGDTGALRLFERGLAAMIERLRPAHILCYGNLPDPTITGAIPVTAYQTRWAGLHQARKDAAESNGRTLQKATH